MKFTSEEFLAGYVGGCFGVVVGHPLDTIKTVQQFTNKRISTTCYDIIVKNNGLRGFYRGLFFPFFAQGFLNSMIFGVAGNVQRHLEDQCKSVEEQENSHAHNVFLSGCAAGFVTPLIGCPVEVVKVRQQTRHCLATHSIGCLKRILRQDGIPGLYRGLNAMLCRDVLPFGVYMLVYDHLFLVLDALSYATELKEHYTNLNDHKHNLDRYYRTIGSISGGIAGTISWIISIPFDAIKTILQADDKALYRGMVYSMTAIVRKHGWKRLFVGGKLLVIRALPVNTATFMGYSYVIEKTKRMKDHD